MGAEGRITALTPPQATCALFPGITYDDDTTEPTGKVLVLGITAAGVEGAETKVTFFGAFVGGATCL